MLKWTCEQESQSYGPKKGRLYKLLIETSIRTIWQYGQANNILLLWNLGIWKLRNYWKATFKFCKLLLHLKTSTPDYMDYGELGRYIKVRMIKLLWENKVKLSHICYKLIYNNNFKNDGFSLWIKKSYQIYFK